MLCWGLLPAGGDQAPVQPLSPAYGYLSEVIQRGIAALLKVGQFQDRNSVS
jgi:hypothetical protein